MLFLAFPPHQWLFFSILALTNAYLIFRSKAAAPLKILSFALMQFTFFFFYHEKSEWYLEIATRSNPENFQIFKWAAITQYSMGSLLIFTIGIFLTSWKKMAQSKFVPVIGALAFTLQLFFSTSTNENSFLIPFLSSDFFKGLLLPLSMYLFGLYGMYFYFLESILNRSKKASLLSCTALITFILLNNFFCPPMNKVPENLVVLSGESFNLDGRNKEDIEKHFQKFKMDRIPSNPIYVWPEAVVTYKKPNDKKQLIVQEMFQTNFPGKHFYGAYAVKENIPGESTNRYFEFDTASGNQKFFNKAFPVPFQENSDYFWFIPQSKIGLSFNVKSSKEFGSFDDTKTFAFYLCNEITELKYILSQWNLDTKLILVPSNTPAQNTEFYEDVLDFYSRVLAKIKRTPLIKVSSHGHIYVLKDDRAYSYKMPVYLSGSDN